jgi:hypothetical protein
VIGIDGGFGHDDLALRIIKEAAHVVMQRALVALECQDIVTALILDLLRDAALAIECVGGHDGALQREHLQQLGYGGDLVGFGIGGDLRQHQALFATPGADHMQGRLAAGALEGSIGAFQRRVLVDRDVEIKARRTLVEGGLGAYLRESPA